MRFDILTIFPHIFDSYLEESLIKKARQKRILDIRIHNLRDFSTDKHKKVDDKPYGGGPGMVLKVGPIYRAVQFLKSGNRKKKLRSRTVLFSTRGKKLSSKIAKRLARYDRLVLICGRYEGVDERVAKYIADEEISIGDFVLNGGEVAAMSLLEAVSRFLPGFLGKKESLEEVKGFYPVYTRPAEFIPKKKANPWRVPKILLSGHHQKIRHHRMTELFTK